MSDKNVSFQRLVDIMDELREKCPWDRKQTIQTLRPLTTEECYELTDAIQVYIGDGFPVRPCATR